jgi:plasmid stabilization system protein ParE
MKIVWTKEGIQTFKETMDFYRFSLNRETANKRKLSVLSKIQILEKFPEAGQVEESHFLKNQNCRYLVADDCKVIYRLNINQVQILKIFDTRQRPDKIKLDSED